MRASAASSWDVSKESCDSAGAPASPGVAGPGFLLSDTIFVRIVVGEQIDSRRDRDTGQQAFSRKEDEVVRLDDTPFRVAGFCRSNAGRESTQLSRTSLT
jgi:hypothetical protein